MPTQRSSRSRETCSILTVTLLAVLAAAPVPAQELRYSIAPQAERIQWHDDVGLEDANLFGGRFGLTFNQYIGLHAFYLTRSGVRAELSRLSLLDTLDMPLTDQDTDLDLFGADLRINVGDGPFSPFLSAGGAVLRFDPDSAPRTSQVALKFGGGIQLGRPGGARLTVFAEDMMFRMNRYALAARDPGGPLQSDSASDDLRHNLAIGAALHVPLGGSPSFDEGIGIGLGAVGMPIEIFAGRLDFDGDAGLARQDLLGVRAGANFGRLVSLRGYFWHGVNDDFDDTAPIRSWGGEAQFNLGAGAGLIPYLLAGAGQIDFRDDYRDLAGNAREDRTSLILGGGAALALSRHLRLNFSARDYLFSDADLADVASTDELRHNWMYTLGFTFNLFGREPSRPVRTVRTTDTLRVTQADTIRLTRADTIRQRDTVYVDAQTGERVTADRARALVRERADQSDAERRRTAAAEERAPRGTAEAQTTESRDFRSPETIVVPVPVQGEVYLRYGPPGSESERAAGRVRQNADPAATGEPRVALRDDIRAIIRDELERARMADAAAALLAPRDTAANRAATRLTSDEFLDRLERRLDQRNALQRDSVRAIVREELGVATPDAALNDRIARAVDERVREAMQDMEQRQPQQRETPPVVVINTDTARAVTATATRPVFTEFEPQSWAGFTGFSITDGSQFLLGTRLDLGSISRGLREVDFIPELALGVGSGATSVHLAAAARYRFTGFQARGLGLVRPYGSLGLGLLNFSNDVEGRDGLDLVINAAYGVTVEVPGLRGFANSGAHELFIEHQGVAFFGLNRLLVGLMWRY